MTLREVQKILDATVVTGEDLLDHSVNTACGSDLMSDVLAYVKDQAILITGLMNQQSIRTAEMMDMVCVIFIRGKQPDESIIQLAREKNIAIMTSDHRMFTTCGLLYRAGLNGGMHIK